MNPPWTITARLGQAEMTRLRRRAIFECCKWDPQIEDVDILADFALVLPATCWRQLAQWSEALYAETLAAEAEVLERPELLRALGLPRALRSVLRETAASVEPNPQALRVMRFDFHYSTEGWRITEVNSDVPGGFIEAAGFTRLMAGHFPAHTLAADPAEEIRRELLATLGAGASVGLVHATAYVDDRQVMTFLQQDFERHGLRASLLGPDAVSWSSTGAQAGGARLDAILRFFPAEWLPNLRGPAWHGFFLPSPTLQCNPGSAIISQSKRFPLIWPELRRPLQAWPQLLPETVDPRALPRPLPDDWVLKPALGRVGEGIAINGVTTPKDLARIQRRCRWFPGEWAAQRRFTQVPCETEGGPLFPCFGVFVIAGRAAGIYARAARNLIVNHLARDVAVLVPKPACELQAAS